MTECGWAGGENKKQNSLLDYTRAGYELNIIFALDFTVNSGNIHKSDAIEKIVRQLATTLGPYSSNEFTMVGYGAKPPKQTDIAAAFNLSFDAQDMGSKQLLSPTPRSMAEYSNIYLHWTRGVNESIQAYKAALTKTRLGNMVNAKKPPKPVKKRAPSSSFVSNFSSAEEIFGPAEAADSSPSSLSSPMDVEEVSTYGPNEFYPVLDGARKIALSLLQKRKYTILFLIATNDYISVEPTIKKLSDSAKSPLSVVLIGVGSVAFKALSSIDYNEFRSKDGFNREYVQLCLFNECAQDERVLCEKVLRFIPGQIVKFFAQKGARPIKN